VESGTSIGCNSHFFVGAKIQIALDHHAPTGKTTQCT
jgi:hypothetical protein